MARLTRDVLVLSNGFSKRAGASVGQGEVPPQVWNTWIAEGIIVDAQAIPLPTQEPEQKTEESPLPHVGDSLSTEPVADPQLRDLPEEELRQMGKKLKLKQWHLMKLPTLIKRIEEQS